MATMLTILFLFITAPSFAQPKETHLKSTYAGQEGRQIKSLSAQDTDDLSNGRG
jgi:hypothetical protein